MICLFFINFLLLFDSINEIMQELLRKKDVFSHSDKDIFDYRLRCSVEPIRDDSTACVNITDNTSSTL